MATQPLAGFSATASSTSSAAPSASSSAGSSDSSGPSTSSATLYLYTFLATLVLLLSVSAAILIRSYLIRRRQRRLVGEAIRDGLISGPPAPGVSIQRAALLSRKPELFDVYLGHAPAEKARGKKRHASMDSASSGASVESGWWNAVMPVAAREVKILPGTTSRARPSPRTSHPPHPEPSTFARFRSRLRVIMPMPSVGASILPAPVTARSRQSEPAAFSPPSAPSPSPGRQSLDIAFLVAMPIPHHQAHHSEQDDLPYVEFGIARVSTAQEVGMDEVKPQ
ncbi:hypothetical protein DAEQUDRAFT_730519 [Daedalea quercina L-15889]|uniref:Uncharacterized protein n=1 Tax=Daedalea quercina L-15889 TaxID=1314783 RepID=A0A165MVG7_9APHY|nr:hypothetical protein DAEQUDRAFT_730519 [Daedalea quercina L-15889]